MTTVSNNSTVSRQLITLTTRGQWLDVVTLVALSISSDSDFYEMNAIVSVQVMSNKATIDLVVADPAFSRGRCQPQTGANLLLGISFAENCVQMKKMD